MSWRPTAGGCLLPQYDSWIVPVKTPLLAAEVVGHQSSLVLQDSQLRVHFCPQKSCCACCFCLCSLTFTVHRYRSCPNALCIGEVSRGRAVGPGLGSMYIFAHRVAMRFLPAWTEWIPHHSLIAAPKGSTLASHQAAQHQQNTAAAYQSAWQPSAWLRWEERAP